MSYDSFHSRNSYRWPSFVHNLFGMIVFWAIILGIALGTLAIVLVTHHHDEVTAYNESFYPAQFWQQVAGTKAFSKNEVGAFARVIKTDLAQAKGNRLPRSITNANVPEGRYPYVAYEARYPFFGWGNYYDLESPQAYKESGKFGPDFLNDLSRFQSHDPGQVAELTSYDPLANHPYFLNWPFYLWILVGLGVSAAAYVCTSLYNRGEYDWTPGWGDWGDYKPQKIMTLFMAPYLVPWVIFLNRGKITLPVIGPKLQLRRYKLEIAQTAANNPLGAELIVAEKHLAEIQKLPHQNHPDVVEARQAAIVTVEALRGVGVRLSEDEAAIKATSHTLALAELFERAKLIHETQDELMSAHHAGQIAQAQAQFRALNKGKE